MDGLTGGVQNLQEWTQGTHPTIFLLPHRCPQVLFPLWWHLPHPYSPPTRDISGTGVEVPQGWGHQWEQDGAAPGLAAEPQGPPAPLLERGQGVRGPVSPLSPPSPPSLLSPLSPPKEPPELPQRSPGLTGC